MLKRAAKLGKYAGEHSSDEETSSDESDPRIRAILAQVEREIEEGKLSLEADDAEDSGMESEHDDENSDKKRKSKVDPKPFCEVNETKKLDDDSEITYTGEKYVCSVCPPRNMWLSIQVEMHVKSKLHKKKAGAFKKEEKKKNLTDEQIKTILERKERKRKHRFERSKLAKKAKKEKQEAEKVKNADTGKDSLETSKSIDTPAHTEKATKPESAKDVKPAEDESVVSPGVDELSLAVTKKNSGKNSEKKSGKAAKVGRESSNVTGGTQEDVKEPTKDTGKGQKRKTSQKSSGKTPKKVKTNES
ncbi:hypothetical protein SARC_07076 [Sphaeroforma arctica JP610]|uniref:Uncharacterized protein n=1 Tax=Sphaeroforma arctica JP610 TaxID=667725 RepID=A0A0L0FX78_9EUKA|nr:hypothetical protein SARC_07076 [Sphaeroforma arctica JP610]KNC80558.1 hypothetical protein SARC_07076 [Sphaeroforma arctica JP610]|eukprot:XP_014154460.1 hypothetical protein SARC_07076 [Sphaeroforma arctica JP610]